MNKYMKTATTASNMTAEMITGIDCDTPALDTYHPTIDSTHDATQPNINQIACGNNTTEPAAIILLSHYI